MSHAATRWALQQRGLKPATKMVLFHLADRHNPEHGCFPSQKTLAEDCEMSERSVRRHVESLEEMGLVSRIQVTTNGRFTATRYLLNFEAKRQRPICPADKSTVGQIERPPAAKLAGRHRPNWPTNLVIEPCKKKQTEGNENEKPETRPGYGESAGQNTKAPGAKPNPRKTEKPSGRDKAQEAFDAWNELAEQHGLPKALALNDRRAQSLRLRIEETGGIDAWKACIGSIPASDFLMGKATKFKAHLDFLCQPTSWLKLREGVYHDGNPPAVDVKPLTDAEVRERQERRLRLVGA